jgi:hypothetical protein
MTMSLSKDQSSVPIVPTNGEIAQSSPYKDGRGNKASHSQKASKSKPNRQQTVGEVLRLKNQIDSMREQEQQRKENTPSVGILTDSVSLVYTGKVAGKTTTRLEPIIAQNEEFATSIHGILTPLIAVCNAALNGRALESRLAKDGQGKDAPILRTTDGEPVYKATSLDKARYAYQLMAENPEVCKKLAELQVAIDKAMEGHIAPKDMIYCLKKGNETIAIVGERIARNAASIMENAQEISSASLDNDVPTLPGE